METTKPWASKTIWVGLVVAIAPFFPVVQAAIAANPELAGVAVSAVFSFLRLINGKKLPLLGTSGKPVSISSPGAVANLEKK